MIPLPWPWPCSTATTLGAELSTKLSSSSENSLSRDMSGSHARGDQQFLRLPGAQHAESHRALRALLERGLQIRNALQWLAVQTEQHVPQEDSRIFSRTTGLEPGDDQACALPAALRERWRKARRGRADAEIAPLNLPVRQQRVDHTLHRHHCQRERAAAEQRGRIEPNYAPGCVNQGPTREAGLDADIALDVALDFTAAGGPPLVGESADHAQGRAYGAPRPAQREHELTAPNAFSRRA